MQCGGGERDDGFLMELLVCFYTEGLPRLRRLLDCTLACNRGERTYKLTGVEGLEGADAVRPVERVIKDDAHALKGSSANVRLWKLAKVRDPRPPFP